MRWDDRTRNMGGAANAVSIGSNPVRGTPHGIAAFARITAGPIIEGAKNNIAAINIVVTILRKFMVAPRSHFQISFPRPISWR